MSFHVGEDIGDYTITALIGAGSMGRVFQVEHRLTKRKEAVKVLSAELATPVQIQRFEREIAVQARLNHPNIATVHNAFSCDGCLVMVTEFLEGQTLEKLLSQGRLPIETGVDYIRQTLSALVYAHDHGVVHRDVTPANLIVTPAGLVKLTDFGVSKSFGDLELTKYGEIVGSLQYMAPEQARGSSHSDKRSDLYSVGAVLYEILTGQKPFGENREFAPLVTNSEANPPPPTELAPFLAPQWNNVVGKALVRDRALRYSTASEFLHAVEKAARATGAMPLTGKLSEWQFWTVVTGVAAAVILLALEGTAKIFAQIPSPPTISFHIPPPEVQQPSAAPIGKAETATVPRNSRVHRARIARTNQTPRVGALLATPPIPSNSQPTRTSAIAPVPKNAPETATMLPSQPALQPAQDLPASREIPAPVADEPKPAHRHSFWNRVNPFRKRSKAAVEQSPTARP